MSNIFLFTKGNMLPFPQVSNLCARLSLPIAQSERSKTSEETQVTGCYHAIYLVFILVYLVFNCVLTCRKTKLIFSWIFKLKKWTGEIQKKKSPLFGPYVVYCCIIIFIFKFYKANLIVKFCNYHDDVLQKIKCSFSFKTATMGLQFLLRCKTHFNDRNALFYLKPLFFPISAFLPVPSNAKQINNIWHFLLFRDASCPRTDFTFQQSHSSWWSATSWHFSTFFLFNVSGRPFQFLSFLRKLEKNTLQNLCIIFIRLKQRVWLFNDGDDINEK